MNIPTTRGMEYAARRLFRVASGYAAKCAGLEQRRIDWADLDESSRRGWRHLAIVLWCQPYTRKGAR